MSTIRDSSYGTAGVRLVKLTRKGDLHDVKDITVDVRFAGAFDSVYADGDNTMVLPTDSMKNAIYAKAHEGRLGEIEEFGLRLSEYFLGSTPDVRQVMVALTEQVWTRLTIGGRPNDNSFVRGDEKRTAWVERTAAGVRVEAGIEGLSILKTASAGFEDFLTDPYTTQPDTSDRLLAVVIGARWLYRDSDVAYRIRWQAVRQALLQAFSEHESRSTQHTLHTMAQAALDACDELVQIRLSLPSRDYATVDLSPFGLSNEREIFVPSDEPHSLIEATLRRDHEE